MKRVWWLALAIGVGCALNSGNPPAVSIRPAIPFNDTTAVVLHIWNYSPDTVRVMVNAGGGEYQVGIVPPRLDRYMLLASTGLGNAPSLLVALRSPSMDPRQPPAIIRRGGVASMSVGQAPVPGVRS